MPLLRLVPVLLVVLAGGCHFFRDRPPSTGNGVEPDGRGKRRPPDKGKPPGPDQGKRVAGALLPAEGVACAVQRCVYHPGGDGYFTCLAGGGGACFHYGAPCEPSGRCMYDRSTGTYRACADVRDGRCVTFGAACEFAGRCLFDPRDGLHRTCKRVDQGRCVEPGATCDP